MAAILAAFHFADSIVFMAPEVGLEPTTLRLTAECSAIELLRSVGNANTRALRFISYSKIRIYGSKAKSYATQGDRTRMDAERTLTESF